MEVLEAETCVLHRPDCERFKTRRKGLWEARGTRWRFAAGKPRSARYLSERRNPSIRCRRINPIIDGGCSIVREDFDASFVEENTQVVTFRRTDEGTTVSDIQISATKTSLYRYDNSWLTVGGPPQFKSKSASPCESCFDFSAVNINALNYRRLIKDSSKECISRLAKSFDLWNRLLA